MVGAFTLVSGLEGWNDNAESSEIAGVGSEIVRWARDLYELIVIGL